MWRRLFIGIVLCIVVPCFGATAPTTVIQLAEGKTLSIADKIKNYRADTVRDSQLNASIPPHNSEDGRVRVMSCNIHFWTKPGGNRNDWSYEPLLAVIDTVKPDIVVMQEVSFDKERTGNQVIIQRTRQEIEDLFKQRGYRYIIFQPLTRARAFGNMIIAKQPFRESNHRVYAVDRKESEHRGYIRVRIGDIVLYGTHLDVWDSTGTRRKKELEELVKAMNGERCDNVMALGDFNAIRPEDYEYTVGSQTAWDIIKAADKKRFEHAHPGTPYLSPLNVLAIMSQHGYKDCFAYTGKLMPRYTVWSGKVIDFIFLKSTWKLPIAGCYPYYTAASDHLPLIIDIKKAQ